MARGSLQPLTWSKRWCDHQANTEVFYPRRKYNWRRWRRKKKETLSPHKETLEVTEHFTAICNQTGMQFPEPEICSSYFSMHVHTQRPMYTYTCHTYHSIPLTG